MNYDSNRCMVPVKYNKVAVYTKYQVKKIKYRKEGQSLQVFTIFATFAIFSKLICRIKWCFKKT